MEIVKPTLLDVDGIYSLVEYFAKRGDVLKRSREDIASVSGSLPVSRMVEMLLRQAA